VIIYFENFIKFWGGPAGKFRQKKFLELTRNNAISRTVPYSREYHGLCTFTWDFYNRKLTNSVIHLFCSLWVFLVLALGNVCHWFGDVDSWWSWQRDFARRRWTWMLSTSASRYYSACRLFSISLVTRKKVVSPGFGVNNILDLRTDVWSLVDDNLWSQTDSGSNIAYYSGLVKT